MAYSPGAAGQLFHANFKINSDEKGFTLKFHLTGADYAAVKPKAIELAGYLKPILPQDCEIFYATITKDNSERDSKFLRDALGAGTYVEAAGPPVVPGKTNRPEDSVLIRCENTEGQWVTYKFPCIPDNIITSAGLVGGTIADVTSMPGVIGAPGSGADWFADFNLLLKAVVKNTIYVKSTHGPGAAFEFALWEGAYFMRTGIKKGGRVFTS